MDHNSLSSSTSQEIDLIYCRCSVSTATTVPEMIVLLIFGSHFFLFFFSFFNHASGGLTASKYFWRESHHFSAGTPPTAPSTCRPLPCRSECRRLPLTPSAPDVSGSVRWGPASQFANEGGRSWWCWRVPGCRPRPLQRSTSPWGRWGLGWGRPPGRPGMAQRGSAAVGTTAGWRRSPFPSPPGSSWLAWPASWSAGCLVRLRRPPQRAACGTPAASRRCEAESESGSVTTAVGRWGCWTLMWKAPGCLSCCPGDKKSRQRSDGATTARTDTGLLYLGIYFCDSHICINQCCSNCRLTRCKMALFITKSSVNLKKEIKHDSHSVKNVFRKSEHAPISLANLPVYLEGVSSLHWRTVTAASSFLLNYSVTHREKAGDSAP